MCSTPVGASPSTSATRRPFTAKRLCAKGSHPCIGCPFSCWHISSWRCRASPRALDVIEADQPAGGVDGHADRVEADGAGRRANMRGIREPGGCELAQTRELTGSRPDHGPLACERRLRARAHAAGLDLDKDERVPVEGDQVDLAVTRALVAP